MSFDLRSLVRDVCAESELADPVSLAALALDAIDEADTREALEQALPIVVRTIVSRARGGHSAETSDDAIPAPRATIENREVIPAQRAATPPRGSRKVAGIRTEHAALSERYPVAIGGQWKFLRECTGADLDYAAGLRESHAAATAANAAKLRRLAKQLAEHGVDTVAELPAEVIAEIMNDTEAAAS